MERPYWSFNQISKYLRCPLSYYFEYVIGLPRPTVAMGQLLGAVVHDALAAYNVGLMKGTPLDLTATRNAFQRAWNERVAKDRIVFADPDQVRSLIDQGLALIEAYLDEPAAGQVVGVEQKLLAPISNSQGEILEKPLMAVVDLVTRDDDSVAIIDFKTSARAYSELEAATSLQPTCYINNVSLLYGVSPSFRFTVLIKTKKPRVQNVEVVKTEDDLGRLGDVVQTIDRAIDAGVFYPVENPLNCSSCPYRKPCRDWGPNRPVTTYIPTLSLRSRGA